jgi:hypothetical protein
MSSEPHAVPQAPEAVQALQQPDRVGQVRVLPDTPDRPGLSRAPVTTDGGSLDDFLDATKIQHAIGGR